MSSRRSSWWLGLGIVFLALGSFYEFVPRKLVKELNPALIFDVVIWGKRVRQNDIILVASLLLIVGVVFVYKWIKRGGKK